MRKGISTDKQRMEFAVEVLKTASAPMTLDTLSEKTDALFVKATEKPANVAWTKRMLGTWGIPLCVGLDAIVETNKGLMLNKNFAKSEVDEAVKAIEHSFTTGKIDLVDSDVHRYERKAQDIIRAEDEHQHTTNIRPTCTFHGCNAPAKSKGVRKDGTAKWGKFCGKHNEASARSDGPVVLPVDPKKAVTIP